MKKDRARYDDGDDVRCRTCHAVFSRPSPVHWGQHFGAHHPSCMAPRKIRCDATDTENSEDIRSVCGKDPSFWKKANNLCYCNMHIAGISELQPITAMTKEVVADVLARQRAELG